MEQRLDIRTSSDAWLIAWQRKMSTGPPKSSARRPHHLLDPAHMCCSRLLSVGKFPTCARSIN